MNHRHFQFYYLNTGGGHRSAAKNLKDLFKLKYPEVTVSLVNGFSENNSICNLLFENFYRISCNFFPASYSLTYRLLNHKPLLYCVENFLEWFITPYLEKKILEENPTDIVCFHFALERFLKHAIQKINPSIRLTVIVLDPFTFHSSWVWEKTIDYYFFSEQAREYAVEHYNVPKEHTTVVPFLINQNFCTTPSQEEVISLKQKHAIPLDKKVVLLTGGGEGLSKLIPIVTQLAEEKADFVILAVCGKDQIVYKAMMQFAKKHPELFLKVYGFVDCMPDFVKICDCAVIKAGPASLIEVLSQKKPVILCHFIYGQEQGNVEFAIQNDVGSFVTEPKKICASIEHILHDEEYAQLRIKKLESLAINTNSMEITDRLMAKV